MGKDAREIRREIEETRARMGDTVEALGYKANVPERVKDAVNERVETVKGTISDVVDSVRTTVGAGGARVGRTLGDVRSTTMQSVGGASAKLRDSSGSVSSSVAQSGARLRDKLPDGEDVRSLASRVGIAAENPLGLALGALAVGFLAGLLIPTTDYERRTVGPLRDELLDRAQTVGGDVLEHGRTVLEETAQATIAAAQQSAQQHGQQILAGGLDPQTLAGNAVEHGKQILRETAQTAMQTAQQKIEEHGKQVIDEARGTEQHRDNGMNQNRVPLDTTGMTGDTGPAKGTRPRSGLRGDIGDTAPSAGMPSDASQGGGLRAGTDLEGGSGAQTIADTGSTSRQYLGADDELRPGSPGTASP